MKAIVFATKMGGGHMSAAQAVADALDRRGCKAQVCDFLTLTGRRTSDIVGGAYVKLVQHSPAAFGRIYRAGQLISSPHIKSVVYLANTLYATTLSEYIAQYSPDVLLTSHIFASAGADTPAAHGRGLAADDRNNDRLHLRAVLGGDRTGRIYNAASRAKRGVRSASHAI